jgi:hypothetical protein
MARAVLFAVCFVTVVVVGGVVFVFAAAQVARTHKFHEEPLVRIVCRNRLFCTSSFKKKLAKLIARDGTRDGRTQQTNSLITR